MHRPTTHLSHLIDFMLVGEGAIGKMMRFRLTFEGPLKSNQSKRIAKHKHEVRRYFHPQLKNFWNSHVLLSRYRLTVPYHKISDRPFQGAFGFGLSENDGQSLEEVISENKDFSRHKYRFVPLVCEKFCLQCSLGVLFLREGPPGTLTNGDLDNRLKTLLDALRMPTCNELQNVEGPGEEENPFFCLLEDDKFITSLSVESDSLLSSEIDQRNYAKVIIEVNIQPIYSTNFNLGF